MVLNMETFVFVEHMFISSLLRVIVLMVYYFLLQVESEFKQITAVYLGAPIIKFNIKVYSKVALIIDTLSNLFENFNKTVFIMETIHKMCKVKKKIFK